MIVLTRHDALPKAMAAAKRLSAKFGEGRFAVMGDDMGIKGFTHRFAVVTFAGYHEA